MNVHFQYIYVKCRCMAYSTKLSDFTNMFEHFVTAIHVLEIAKYVTSYCDAVTPINMSMSDLQNIKRNRLCSFSTIVSS